MRAIGAYRLAAHGLTSGSAPERVEPPSSAFLRVVYIVHFLHTRAVHSNLQAVALHLLRPTGCVFTYCIYDMNEPHSALHVLVRSVSRAGVRVIS